MHLKALVLFTIMVHTGYSTHTAQICMNPAVTLGPFVSSSNPNVTTSSMSVPEVTFPVSNTDATTSITSVPEVTFVSSVKNIIPWTQFVSSIPDVPASMTSVPDVTNASSSVYDITQRTSIMSNIPIIRRKEVPPHVTTSVNSSTEINYKAQGSPTAEVSSTSCILSKINYYIFYNMVIDAT